MVPRSGPACTPVAAPPLRAAPRRAGRATHPHRRPRV